MKIPIKLIASQLLICALGLSIGSIVGANYLLHTYSGRYRSNTQVNNIDISHHTLDEARTLIQTEYLGPLMQQTITLSYQDQATVVPFSKLIANTDLDTLLSEALISSEELTYLQKLSLLKDETQHTYQLSLTTDDESIAHLATSFADKYSTSPVDATIHITSSGDIQITASQDAIIWNTTQLVADIKKALQEQMSVQIDMENYLQHTAPSVTTEMLQQVNARVSRYSTRFKLNSGNQTNISLAAKTINGTCLLPGDTFSFNDIVGDTTLEKGYTYAPVIANSKLIQGVGGGVCQVSSTLYNAMLLTGLTATERQPHSKPSSYVPLGQDATIDWGTIDFKFKNTLKYPLYICAYTENNMLYVDLYSNKSLLDTTYVVENDIYETLSSPIRFINDSSLPKGTTALSSAGSKGYRVKVTRKKYQNDELVDTTTISSDVYHSSPTVYRRGA